MTGCHPATSGQPGTPRVLALLPFLRPQETRTGILMDPVVFRRSIRGCTWGDDDVETWLTAASDCFCSGGPPC